MSLNPAFKVALAGNPNCGKTALFNALTAGSAKVGNYPGVTVERKVGRIKMPAGLTAENYAIELIDLPGTYSLEGRTPDERITQNVLLGGQLEEKKPELIIAVVDSTQLSRGLGLVLELRSVGIPVVVVLNMIDLARRSGLTIDQKALAQKLNAPVVMVSATQKEGIIELLKEVVAQLNGLRSRGVQGDRQGDQTTLKNVQWTKSPPEEIRRRFAEIDQIVKEIVQSKGPAHPVSWSDSLDRVVLHPVFGIVFLLAILAFMFQAIFTWAQIPMEWIEAGVRLAQESVGRVLGEGPLQSLLADGVIAGIGAVLVFLPQIIFLFLFILIFEDSGYMARAAFLMDRLMSRVGLNGRAFIPLLTSYACAIPGIMATRTIANRRDRFVTILVAPLMTCSARLPVYSLLIAAFIPNVVVWKMFRLQGLVMFGLYLAGMVFALGVAFLLKKTVFKGDQAVFLMELPTYKWPNLYNICIGLIERSKLFVQNAGSVILTVSIVLWFLASYPKPPVGAPVGAMAPAITYSYAGKVGRAVEPLVKPLGFNWKIAVALIPGFAAREVMIGSLATVYAVEAKAEQEPSEGDQPIEAEEERLSAALGSRLTRDWSVATALSLLIWYVLACQCFSTLAVTRRETGSWRWPVIMFVYMTGLAYAGSFLTYQAAVLLGLG